VSLIGSNKFQRKVYYGKFLNINRSTRNAFPERIKSYLVMPYKIQRDKKKHFFVGIPLGLLLQFVCSYLLPANPIWAIVMSFVILAAGCYGFELFSLVTGKGHAENLDAIAGILGGMIGIAVYWCIRIFI